MRSKIAGHVVLMASLFLLYSCSSSSDDAMVGGGTGSIVFSIELPEEAMREVSGAVMHYKAASIPCEEYGIASVEAKVYDENDNLIASGGPWACNLGEGIIYNVKAGNNRTVVIFLRNNDGIVIYQGEKSQIYVPAGGLTNAGIITVDIVPEDVLTAVDDSATVNRGGVVVIPVLDNDVDPQGEGLSVTILTTPSYGAVGLNTDGSIRYTHTDTGNEATRDSFTYQISDHLDNVSSATVNITIIPENVENQPPIANADSVSVHQGGAVVIPVLDNDYDPDGDILSTPELVSGSGPANGEVMPGSDGSFVYIHNGSETETDSFTYEINDGEGATATAVVNIEVLTDPAENHAPELELGTVNPETGQEGDSFTYSVHYFDEDGHSPSRIEVIVNGESHDMDLRSGAAWDGTYVCNIELFEEGIYNYEISCSDGYDGSAVFAGEGPTVLAAANQDPLAVADTISVFKGGTVFIPVLDNDSDPDGDPLSLNPELVSYPANGEVVLLEGRGFVYTHKQIDLLSDSFEYEINDGRGGSATGAVSITIETPGPDDNNPPVLIDGGVSPEAGTQGDTFTYTVHYKDKDGDIPSFIVVFIDGKEYAMDSLSGLPEYDGIYTFMSPLDEPLPARVEHVYVFLCSDGNGGYAVLAGKGPRVVATAYYVDASSGVDDVNRGSIDEPFATIQYAIDMSLETIVINIAAGEYHENLTLDSGTILIGGWSDNFSKRWDFINNDITKDIDSETRINGDQKGRCITADSVQDVLISGVTLTNGNAGDSHQGGSALYLGSCSPEITFCMFIDNTTESDNDIYGGAVFLDNSNPTISRCMFSGNSAQGPHIKHGGAIYSYYSQPVIEKCVFTENHAGCNMGAGGAIYNHESDARIVDCIFSQNSTGGNMSYGGAIYNAFSDPVIVNCIFDRNTASGDYISCGGAVYNASSSPVITNCSFSLNQALETSVRSTGGAVYIDAESSPVITNTILWGDSAGLGDEIYAEEGSMAEISNCYEDDPLFVNPYSGDLHLQEGSPCIDAGTNDAPSITVTDFEGDPRIIQGRIDMGADEYAF